MPKTPRPPRDNITLEEYSITLIIRVEKGLRPDKWDYTRLLDLETVIGEAAWVEDDKFLGEYKEELDG